MTSMPPFSLAPRIIRPDEGPVHAAGPERLRFLLSSEATGGGFHLIETTIDVPHVGPPYHVHSLEDETFMVLEGELIVVVDGVTHHLRPGDVAFAPRNVPHRYESGPNGVRFHLVVTGSNFERFFPRFCEAAGSGQMDRVVAIADEHGITLLLDS